jgi:hypothetical protein
MFDSRISETGGERERDDFKRNHSWIAAGNGVGNWKSVLVQTSKMEPQNTQNTQMNTCAGDAARDHTSTSVHSQNGV